MKIMFVLREPPLNICLIWGLKQYTSGTYRMELHSRTWPVLFSSFRRRYFFIFILHENSVQDTSVFARNITKWWNGRKVVGVEEIHYFYRRHRRRRGRRGTVRQHLTGNEWLWIRSELGGTNCFYLLDLAKRSASSRSDTLHAPSRMEKGKLKTECIDTTYPPPTLLFCFFETIWKTHEKF